jgi:hypothetical protein
MSMKNSNDTGWNRTSDDDDDDDDDDDNNNNNNNLKYFTVIHSKLLFFSPMGQSSRDFDS